MDAQSEAILIEFAYDWLTSLLFGLQQDQPDNPGYRRAFKLLVDYSLYEPIHLISPGKIGHQGYAIDQLKATVAQSVFLLS